MKYRGEVFWRMGRHDDAVQSYRAAQALYEATGSSSGQADILNKLGSVEFNSGRHREAIALFRQTLNRYLKEPERTLDKLNAALELHLLLGNRRLESITRCNIAGTLCDLGRYEDGLTQAVQAKGLATGVNAAIPLIWAHCWEACALRLSRGQDNPRGLAGVLGMLGDLLGSPTSRREEAVTLLREAIDIMEAANLDQAFGGQRRAEMTARLDELTGPRA